MHLSRNETPEGAPGTPSARKSETAFAEMVSRGDPEARVLSSKLRRTLGAPALAELALAVATARMYATLERGLDRKLLGSSQEAELQAGPGGRGSRRGVRPGQEGQWGSPGFMRP